MELNRDVRMPILIYTDKKTEDAIKRLRGAGYVSISGLCRKLLCEFAEKKVGK